jgi:DNA repair ATPase RecN
MENEIIEQLDAEPATNTENSEGSIFGRFKDAKSLLEAYNNLQAEFTRKSQKLADIQKNLSENAFYSNNDSLENILNETTDSDKYKKEIEEILNRDSEISNLPNKNQVAFKIIKETEKRIAETLNNQDYMDKYIDSNKELKDKIITNYLSTLSDAQHAPKVISGNASNIYFSPSISTPKTLKEAGDIFSKMLK